MPNSRALQLNLPGAWVVPLVAAASIVSLAVLGIRYEQADTQMALAQERSGIEERYLAQMGRIKTSLLQIDDPKAAANVAAALHQVIPSLLDTHLVTLDSGRATRIFPPQAPLTKHAPLGAPGSPFDEARLIALDEVLRISSNRAIAFIDRPFDVSKNSAVPPKLVVLWRLPRRGQSAEVSHSHGLATFDLDPLLEAIRGDSLDRLSRQPFANSYEVIINIDGIATAFYFSPKQSNSNSLIWLLTGILVTTLAYAAFNARTWTQRRKLLNERINRLELRQNRQARLAALGELSSRISHELNQPLFAIEAFAATLVRHPEIDERERTDTLHKIRNESARAARATRAILDLTKNQSRAGASDHSDVHLIIEDLSPLLTIEAQKKGIKLTIKIANTGAHRVPRAPVELFVMTTVTNAIEAISETPSTVKNPQVVVEAAVRADQELTIKVSNNGSRIADADAERIFEDFFTTKEGGSGLGLSTARNVARRHAGEVALVRGAASDTTMFELRLPIRQESVTTA
ncbi:MAG: HAMP domain-containing sensor histidine kinase [Bordetella sp.]